jgi:hypothetical protein
VKPISKALAEKWLSIAPTAPLITAVSKPKRNPPTAATAAITVTRPPGMVAEAALCAASPSTVESSCRRATGCFRAALQG